MLTVDNLDAWLKYKKEEYSTISDQVPRYKTLIAKMIGSLERMCLEGAEALPDGKDPIKLDEAMKDLMPVLVARHKGCLAVLKTLVRTRPLITEEIHTKEDELLPRNATLELNLAQDPHNNMWGVNVWAKGLYSLTYTRVHRNYYRTRRGAQDGKYWDRIGAGKGEYTLLAKGPYLASDMLPHGSVRAI